VGTYVSLASFERAALGASNSLANNLEPHRLVAAQTQLIRVAAKVGVAIDFVGFTIDDVFVAGDGTDDAEKYRHLPISGLWSNAPRPPVTSDRGRTQISVTNPAVRPGPRYRSFAMGCAPCIVPERRSLCRRHVGTFQTLLRLATPLRRVPSERTISSEAINCGHAAKEREPWTSDCKASMRS
jgi:hypothetical protein